MYDLLLYDFDLFYNLMKKPLPECARAYKKFVRKFFRYYQKKKNPLKNSDIKTSKRPKNIKGTFGILNGDYDRNCNLYY